MQTCHSEGIRRGCPKNLKFKCSTQGLRPHVRQRAGTPVVVGISQHVKLKTTYFPYRNASLVFRRSAASRNLRRSSAVFKISGGTSFGFFVCSSTATNVTYAVVVCFR